MKFRHPDGVRLALSSGHVTLVGPDWQPLQEMFHQEALTKGCECDQTTIRTRTLEPAVAGPNAVTPLDERAKIRKALILMVERNGEGDFTGSGAPNINIVSKECGFRADKGLVLEEWNSMVEEAQQEEAARKAAEAAGVAGPDGSGAQVGQQGEAGAGAGAGADGAPGAGQ